jgi:hypothetical protein
MMAVARCSLLFLVVFAAPWTFAGDGRVSRDVDVGYFDRIEVSDAVHVTVSRGDTPAVRVTADESAMSRIRAEQSGETLSLGYKDDSWSWFDWGWENGADVLFEVQVRDLKALFVSGASRVALGDMESGDLRLKIAGAAHFTGDHLRFADVDAEIAGAADVRIGALETRRASMKISGSSDIVINTLSSDALTVSTAGASEFKASAGRAEHVTVDVEGASSYKGRNIAAAHVKVRANGASRAEVHADESLQAESHGASDIEYSGEPAELEVNASGNSTIRK